MWASVALLAGTAGARAVPGITAGRLSPRLGPLMTCEAKQMLLGGCTEVELSACHEPDSNRNREAAGRGTQASGDLINEGQDLIASAGFLAGAVVLTGVAEDDSLIEHPVEDGDSRPQHGHCPQQHQPCVRVTQDGCGH